jgi:hypothetical protein
LSRKRKMLHPDHIHRPVLVLPLEDLNHRHVYVRQPEPDMLGNGNVPENRGTDGIASRESAKKRVAIGSKVMRYVNRFVTVSDTIHHSARAVCQHPKLDREPIGPDWDKDCHSAWRTSA